MFSSRITYGRAGARKAGKRVVIIDVLRAVPTAIEIIKQKPGRYLMTSEEKKVCAMNPDYFRVGKPYMGSNVRYDSPNSPTRITECDLTGRSVIHRTAGCGGCLDELKGQEHVLLCTFSNLDVTKRTMKKIGGRWDIIAAGHLGNNPVNEDNLCAKALNSDDFLYHQNNINEKLQGSESLVRFSSNSLEYPLSDLDYCFSNAQNSIVISANRQENMWLIESMNQF